MPLSIDSSTFRGNDTMRALQNPVAMQGATAASTAAYDPELTIESVPTLFPKVMNEYQRVKALGDPRTWQQWATDHWKANPNWMNDIQKEYSDFKAQQVAAQQPQNNPPPTPTGPVTTTAVKDTTAKSLIDATLAKYGGDASKAAVELEQTLTGADMGDPKNAEVASWLASTFPSHYEFSNDTTEQPIEQDVYNRAVPRLMDDIDNDVTRSQLADKSATTVNRTIDDALKSSDRLVQKFDAQSYGASNPDVVNYYNSHPEEQAKGTLNQFLENHYNTFGKNEPRTGVRYVSDQEKLEEMQANKTQGELVDVAREQADAIRNASGVSSQEQLANLSTQTSALKDGTDTAKRDYLQAITDQVSGKDANVDTARGQQLENLSALTQAQRDATGVAKRDYLDAIAQQVQQKNSNTADARGQMIDAQGMEERTLQGALGDQTAARRGALATEIAALKQAQDPVTQARLQAAETEAAGINSGLERTRDSIQAQNAAQGFIGSDSFTDAALLRASIGARQEAAARLGAAKLDNAVDVRTIDSRGATDGRSITDFDASERRGIVGAGATDRRGISDWSTKESLGINNTGADDTRTANDFATNRLLSIADADATGRKTIGDWSAGQKYTNANTGLDDKRTVNDFATNRNLGISDANAGATRTIGDWLSGQKLATATTEAEDVGKAKTLGTSMRQQYFDADLGRSLASALQPVTLEKERVNTLVGLDEYKNSGLKRSLNTLNWWAGSNQPYNPEVFNQQANTTWGDTLAGVGAGITNLAGQFAIAKYAQPAKTATNMTSNTATVPNTVAAKKLYE